MFERMMGTLFGWMIWIKNASYERQVAKLNAVIERLKREVQENFDTHNAEYRKLELEKDFQIDKLNDELEIAKNNVRLQSEIINREQKRVQAETAMYIGREYTENQRQVGQGMYQ